MSGDRTASPPFGRFFLPGPTAVRREVLEAQTAAMMGHRGPGIQALMEELQKGLKDVFRTERPVFIAGASATGFMEAAVRNSGPGCILALTNGAFGERFEAIGRACGLDVEVLSVPWGESQYPDRISQRLAARDYEAVTVVHSETSTGALNDIEAIARVVREHPGTLLLVDSVTGVGGAEMRTDAWGPDFVLTGSQKAMALPPGMAFSVASDAMMARAEKAPGRGMYFDLVEYAANMEKLQTPTTPPLSLLYALKTQLAAIGEETMEGRWQRHLDMARRTWAWVDEMHGSGVDVSVLAPEGSRAPTVTCVCLPDETGGPAVVKAMADRGWVIGGGYGKLKGATIRIGHMGDHTVNELEELLDVLGDVLR